MFRIFGYHTRWVQSLGDENQTDVFHNSVDAEVIAVGTSVRMEGLPVISLWDCVFDVVSLHFIAEGNHVQHSIPSTHSTSNHSF